MACTAITDIVVRESGRYLADEIFKRNFARSPWQMLLKRGEYPRGLGDTINVLTYERSAPTDAAPTWATVSTVDGTEGGACLPTATKVAIASTTRNFGLARRVLEGPDFCAEDLRTPFELEQQLNAITDILAEYVRLEWDIRDRNEYFRLCKRKVVVDGCPPTETFTGAATYPAAEATSVLTQGILDRYKAKLFRDGAQQSALGQTNGMPVLTLICSMETSDNIIKTNADVRQDLRWGNPGELLKALGVEREYRGFYHVYDAYPRRFTYAGGAYTNVAAFATQAATKGNKAEVNSSWETAGFEESFIFDPTVYTQLIPRPVTTPAPNYRFDPVTYTGVWQVKNILNRDCNPDGNILYHRGILAAGSLPVHPERGVAFVHLRCDPACNLVLTCPS